MKDDLFELSGPPPPRLSVWMIARGVFWGQVLFIAAAVVVGIALKGLVLLAEAFKLF